MTATSYIHRKPYLVTRPAEKASDYFSFRGFDEKDKEDSAAISAFCYCVNQFMLHVKGFGDFNLSECADVWYSQEYRNGVRKNHLIACVHTLWNRNSRVLREIKTTLGHLKTECLEKIDFKSRITSALVTRTLEDVLDNPFGEGRRHYLTSPHL